MSDVELLEHLKRVDVQPGDKFVLISPRPLSTETCQRFREVWNRFVGSNAHPVLILDDGMELGVIRGAHGDAGQPQGAETTAQG